MIWKTGELDGKVFKSTCSVCVTCVRIILRESSIVRASFMLKISTEVVAPDRVIPNQLALFRHVQNLSIRFTEKVPITVINHATFCRLGLATNRVSYR